MQSAGGAGSARAGESLWSGVARPDAIQGAPRGRAGQDRGGRDAAGLAQSAVLLIVETRLGAAQQGAVGTVATESAKPCERHFV